MLLKSQGSWVQENISTHCSMPDSSPDNHQSLEDALSSSGYVIPLSKGQLFFSLFVYFY